MLSEFGGAMNSLCVLIMVPDSSDSRIFLSKTFRKWSSFRYFRFLYTLRTTLVRNRAAINSSRAAVVVMMITMMILFCITHGAFGMWNIWYGYYAPDKNVIAAQV